MMAAGTAGPVALPSLPRFFFSQLLLSLDLEALQTQTKDMQRQEGAAPQHIAIHQVAATPNRSFTSDAQGGSADLSPDPRAAQATELPL